MLTKQKLIFENGKHIWRFILSIGGEEINIKGYGLDDNVNLHILATEIDPIHISRKENK